MFPRDRRQDTAPLPLWVAQSARLSLLALGHLLELLKAVAVRVSRVSVLGDFDLEIYRRIGKRP